MNVEYDVIVVGAGPSGLMAAVCLATLGVRVLVIDHKDGPTRESRALALQARSLEIFDQLDIASRVLGEGNPAPSICPGYGRRVFGSLSLARMGTGVTPYPGLFILEQSKTERILRDVFLARGGEIRWGCRMRDLRVVDEGQLVEVVCDGRAGDETIRARWCIGADGASSGVRNALGLSFEGVTNELSFFVADARDAAGLVPDAINMRIHGDDFILGFPMGAPGHFRILGVADAPDALPDADLERLIQRRLEEGFGIRYSESTWFSRYRAHHRLATHFRVGPVFLVGDAAHVHSPVGAQGMNTGLQDAHNLAFKLAEVIRGTAGVASLASYEAERRPVAAILVKTTDAAFVRLTSRGRIAGFVRDRVVPVIAPLALPIVPRLVGTERLYGYLSQTRIRYRMPSVSARDKAVGRRLPWTGSNYAAVRRTNWQVHSYGAPGADCVRVAGAIDADPHSFNRDPHHRLSDRRLYLVRPDGFVAAAAKPGRASEVFLAVRASLSAV
ncbi:FAD-dependent monooxygenase [Microbacterium sp. AZCO]|uniref:FAD-dependent monooxygenase n=1 Tax=Microbacterium sp. AZCO TaxID=3142976 RepID=UPI0031F45A1D